MYKNDDTGDKGVEQAGICGCHKSAAYTFLTEQKSNSEIKTVLIAE